jgi:glycosyltransferase involved in cell wall biosynthesis
MNPAAAYVPGLVSVVIPAYNAGPFIADAVQSALAQSYRPLEIVVTDDGSTDGTATVLKQFGSAIQVVSQPNGGLASARNSAVRASRGEFVAFLDADDTWHPDKIARQVAAISSDNACGVVHTAASFVDGNRRPVDRKRHPWHERPFRGRCSAELIAHNTIVVSSVLMRRHLMPADGFRPFYGCEDWDLWLRVSAHADFAYVDEPLTQYRVHQSNMSSNVPRMLESSIGVLRAFAEAGGNSTLLAAARREAHAQCLSLAGHHFYRGEYRAARKWYGAAGWPLSPGDAARWAACWCPPPFLGVARRLQHLSN